MNKLASSSKGYASSGMTDADMRCSCRVLSAHAPQAKRKCHFEAHRTLPAGALFKADRRACVPLNHAMLPRSLLHIGACLFLASEKSTYAPHAPTTLYFA
jgi:hypothetical protein